MTLQSLQIADASRTLLALPEVRWRHSESVNREAQWLRAIEDFVLSLNRQGTSTTAWGQQDHIFITGGLAHACKTTASAALANVPTHVDTAGAFGALHGAAHYLTATGRLKAPAILCDLGRVGLKIMVGARKWHFMRNFAVLHTTAQAVRRTEWRTQRRALHQFLSIKLKTVMDQVDCGLRTIVWITPYRVGTGSQSSRLDYVGWDGEPGLLNDVTNHVDSHLDGFAMQQMDVTLYRALTFPSGLQYTPRRRLVITTGATTHAMLLDHALQREQPPP